MKIGSMLLFTAMSALVGTSCIGRETPIRDRIKERREARAAERQAKPKGAIETIKVVHDGLDRAFMLQMPTQKGALTPVLIVLHGGTRGAEDIFERTSWPAIAKRERLILAAPQGIDNQWNDGRETTLSGKRSTADDVGFLDALIAKLVSDHGADPRAIFVTGVSNGGLMTMRLACERSASVTAIAPVIATMPEVMAPACKAAAPVPALFMAGTADPLMTYDGQPSALAARRGPTAPMLSMPATLDLWRIRNGCSDKGGVRDLADVSRDDQSTVSVIEYRPCTSRAPVIHYRVNGGGHQLPSLKPQQLSPQFAKLLGPQNNDIEGPEEIWKFFAAQMRR
jgi:polyhydroxybutyrate depolymerase